MYLYIQVFEYGTGFTILLFATTIIWEGSMFKSFWRAGQPWKVNVGIFMYMYMYNECFAPLIFRGCHDLRKYSYTKNFR